MPRPPTCRKLKRRCDVLSAHGMVAAVLGAVWQRNSDPHTDRNQAGDKRWSMPRTLRGGRGHAFIDLVPCSPLPANVIRQSCSAPVFGKALNTAATLLRGSPEAAHERSSDSIRSTALPCLLFALNEQTQDCESNKLSDGSKVRRAPRSRNRHNKPATAHVQCTASRWVIVVGLSPFDVGRVGCEHVCWLMPRSIFVDFALTLVPAWRSSVLRSCVCALRAHPIMNNNRKCAQAVMDILSGTWNASEAASKYKVRVPVVHFGVNLRRLHFRGETLASQVTDANRVTANPHHIAWCWRVPDTLMEYWRMHMCLHRSARVRKLTRPQISLRCVGSNALGVLQGRLVLRHTE